VAETVTLEVPPRQSIGDAFTATVISGGSVIVTDAVVAVQPFASVTVKV
jgi:hypothetical protein